MLSVGRPYTEIKYFDYLEWQSSPFHSMNTCVFRHRAVFLLQHGFLV